MKESTTKNWKNKQQNIALLFFSQLVEELLFHYTIDSFKLPAHNICTLISEAKKTIEHIENLLLKEGSYDSIKCELVDIVSKDKIFTNIFEAETEVVIEILNKKNLNETKKLLDYIQIQLKNDYYNNLVSTLREKIKTNDFDDLIRLTKSLLIELLANGYSSEYINISNRKIFHYNQVESISSYDFFIREFNNEKIECNVYFKVSNKYMQYKEFFDKNFVAFQDNIELIDSNRRLEQFKSLPGCILKITVDAKDPFKAFNKAKFFVENVTSRLMAIQHQGEFSISKMGVIQYNSSVYYYTGANNPIFRRPDHLLVDRAKHKFKIIVNSMNSTIFDNNSKERMSLAYLRHFNSIRSVSFQTQLVDMWSGIEILVPTFRNDSSDKINQIIESILPLITSQYFFKITYYIYKSIESSLKKIEIVDILKQVDDNLYFALLKCMMTESHESAYKQIYDILSLYPLLQKRLDYYKSKLNSPKEILSLYLNHQKRVKWQIQRIYRGRNLIIHSGKTPYRLDTLIENLHYYFDSVMDKINDEISKAKKNITLEHIFLVYRFRDDKYIKYLKKNKNGKIDDSFIRTIIHREF